MKEPFNKIWQWGLLLYLAAAGCQIEDSHIDRNESIVGDTGLLEWTIDQNRWIFSQMKYHYLWNEELKDSASYDYTLEPSRFFESMIVPQDRFSYCKKNDEYVGTKADGRNESIPKDSVYVRNNLRIGYFEYDEFASAGDITDIVIYFLEEGIDELVIDLRDNPGGLVLTCVQLASYIVPESALGSVFCYLQYNSTISAEREKNYGTPYTFYHLKGDVTTRKRNLRLSRVVFLANERSASCSELLINCLRPYLDVILIGTTTVGKDVGMYSLKGRQYKYVLEPITFRSYNANDIPVPETGLVPDIEITQPPYIEDGEKVDPALEAAFTYLETIDTNTTSI